MKRKYTFLEIVGTIIVLGLMISPFILFAYNIKTSKSIDKKSSYEYAQDGYNKQQKGEKLNKNEREALDSYNKWEEKQESDK